MYLKSENGIDGGIFLLGKGFANRKSELDRPKNDFYPTPSCVVKELIFSGLFEKDKNVRIYDPCCGEFAIGNVLREYGYNNIVEKDIMYGDNFLVDYTDDIFDVIIMNPPFKHFDKFVEKAKIISNRVYCIGKMTLFGAHGRNINRLWEHLEWVLPFDRQIAFDLPEINGKVGVGMLVSCWMIWNKNYCDYPKIKVLDVQKYIR